MEFTTYTISIALDDSFDVSFCFDLPDESVVLEIQGNLEWFVKVNDESYVDEVYIEKALLKVKGKQIEDSNLQKDVEDFLYRGLVMLNDFNEPEYELDCDATREIFGKYIN